MNQPRFVRRDRRIYHDSYCQLCGTCYGICKGEKRVCREATCLACGSKQCSVNGLGRGQCGICLIGLLTGWSGSEGRQCSYAGCSAPAVVRVDGVNKLRCHMHVDRGKWAGYIAERLQEREQIYVEVDAATITDIL